MMLPRNLTFGLGAGLFVFATFNAFGEAFAFQQPTEMLHSFVSIFVGMWFMFAATSGLRGSHIDDEMVKRVMAMTALMFLVIVGSLYLRDPRLVALMNLSLISCGFVLTQSFLKQTR